MDGYAGYHVIPNITLVGGWAHVRRKFDEALKAFPPDQAEAQVPAKAELGFCSQLFANTSKAATASATIYSVIESAQENCLNPYGYLEYLLEQLPNIDLMDEDALDDLMFWAEGLPAHCRSNNK